MTPPTPLLTAAGELAARFPAPAALRPSLSLAGQGQFAADFVRARDRVEADHYAEVDRAVAPGERSRRFLAALLAPVLARPVRDPEHFYETFGRLMRWAWLSVSVGIYDDAIGAVPDAARRLHAAQVNTVDLAWRAAVSALPPDGTIVEIGTGRGNSVARLAQLFPRARIVSITVSPEQATIARRTVAEMGLTGVEIRCGDLFDPAVTRDLVGQAAAVGAIEVTGHFPPALKARGIAVMARLLTRGGSLSLLDSATPEPLPGPLEAYYRNQSWYFGKRDDYLKAFAEAGAPAVAYVDHSRATLPTFVDTTTVLRRHRDRLRAEFGGLMALVWPELPRAVYLPTVRRIQYAHIVGIRA